MANVNNGQLILAPNFSYRRRPNGTEVVTESANPIWINVDFITEIESTVNSPESLWWKVTIGGTRLYLNRDTVDSITNSNGIEDPIRFAVDPIGRVEAFPNIATYEYSGARVRPIGATVYIKQSDIVLVERMDARYFKVIMFGGARYYTDVAGAEACGVELGAVPR
jgi:hypothetical protein